MKPRHTLTASIRRTKQLGFQPFILEIAVDDADDALHLLNAFEDMKSDNSIPFDDVPYKVLRTELERQGFVKK